MFGDEIEALTLMDAGIPGITLPEMLPSSSDKAWKTWHFAFHAVPDLPEILLEGRERPYLEWFFWHKSANPAVYGEEEINEYLRIYSAPGGLRAGLAFYRAAARSAEQNRILAAQGKLTMLVLGLSADQGSIPDMAAAIRPFAVNVRGETIRDCGHFQPEEQPAAVADALLRFLAHAELTRNGKSVRNLVRPWGWIAERPAPGKHRRPRGLRINFAQPAQTGSTARFQEAERAGFMTGTDAKPSGTPCLRSSSDTRSCPQAG
jgi:hypothetical protein